jgi:hypothetical protein
MNRITLYTSIPPRLIRQSQQEDYGESYQNECINSWREAGFRVVSINPGCEIEALVGKEYDVEFLSNGSSQNRTTLGAFLSTIAASREDVAGIINADCYLMSPGVAIDNLLKAATGAIILLERLNIDPNTMRACSSSIVGFDGFFFDTRFVARINDGDNWTIGNPIWDYWFPLAMHIGGAIVKAPSSPIIFHLTHEPVWSYADVGAAAIKLLRLLCLDLEGRLPAELAREIHNICNGRKVEEVDLCSFCECMGSWLRRSSQKFCLCPPGSPGEFVSRMLAGMAATATRESRLPPKRRALSIVKEATLNRFHSLLLSMMSRKA